jgi:hypothetical protein
MRDDSGSVLGPEHDGVCFVGCCTKTRDRCEARMTSGLIATLHPGLNNSKVYLTLRIVAQCSRWARLAPAPRPGVIVLHLITIGTPISSLLTTITYHHQVCLVPISAPHTRETILRRCYAVPSSLSYSPESTTLESMSVYTTMRAFKAILGAVLLVSASADKMCGVSILRKIQTF